MSAPLVILDRDGVINRDSKDFVRSAREWVPIAGSIEAIARLSRAGFRVIIATNQSGLARGLFTQAELDAMHDKLRGLVHEAGGAIEAIYVCPELPDEPDDRKHRLLRRIATELDRPLTGVPAIGDSPHDIQAARDVGARPVLVRTGNGVATEQQCGDDPDVTVYDDLAAAVRGLLDQR